MIGYVMLGTNDFDRATKFYDELLGTIGAGPMMQSDSFVAWVAPPDKGALCVTKPHDGKAATVGNGVMVALAMDSKEKVDAFYKKAIELGATDEGEPGPRGEGGFYAGYFREQFCGQQRPRSVEPDPRYRPLLGLAHRVQVRRA